MKIKTTIIAGFAMLLLYTPIYGKLIINQYRQSISVTSDRLGISGLHGCDPDKATPTEAFVFRLQRKTRNIVSTCSIAGGNKWQTEAEKNSKDGSVTFDQLPEGIYRIVALSGEAIGCKILGTQERSIIYAREVSEVIVMGGKQPNHLAETEAVNTDLQVFPNPASDLLNIQLKSEELDGDLQISLLDLLGRDIKRQLVSYASGTEQTWELNVSGLSSGTYLVKLTDSKGEARYKKIIVQLQQQN